MLAPLFLEELGGRGRSRGEGPRPQSPQPRGQRKPLSPKTRGDELQSDQTWQQLREWTLGSIVMGEGTVLVAATGAWGHRVKESWAQ